MAKSDTPSVLQTKRRVFLVEDHPVTREGFAQLINVQPDLVVCGRASGAPEALKGIAKSQPDIVVVDLTLAEGSGLDLIKDLAARNPRLPAIVLSVHDEKIYAERALHAGARGYVMKEEPIEHVLACIRGALRGESCVSEAMRLQMLGTKPGSKHSADAGISRLSDRELEVFEQIGMGRGTREIARRLHVSVSTVENYRAKIKEKLGLTNATELAATAGRWKLSKN